MSFPSQLSHRDLPIRLPTSSLPSNVTALSQPQSQSQFQSQPQPTQPQFHSQPQSGSQQVTINAMQTLTDPVVQSVHVPHHHPTSSRSLVSSVRGQSQDSLSISSTHGLCKNQLVEFPERQSPIFENPGVESSNFSEMSVRTADNLFLQSQSQAPTHSTYTGSSLSTALARRHGLFHNNDHDSSSDSDDADSDPSSDPPPSDHNDEQDEKLLSLEIWNWPTLLISGCMFDVYGSLSKPIPS